MPFKSLFFPIAVRYMHIIIAIAIAILYNIYIYIKHILRKCVEIEKIGVQCVRVFYPAPHWVFFWLKKWREVEIFTLGWVLFIYT